MLITKEYDRLRAQMYAERWALSRNPLFLDFAGRGGDCTSFVSQAVLAGGCTMNFTPTYGWYYISPDDRAAAWTGVPYFYNFLLTNNGPGPFGEEVEPGMLEIGDVIQLGRADGVFYHTLIVTGFSHTGYLVSAHTDDALNRPLSTYTYDQARYLHINGIREEVPDREDCFEALINGEAIVGVGEP
ncbi:MAG: amidase domain-containing protein [Clostridia bacterium]|nr:amidase domain-containing protein [Clostridia bacterium]